MRATTIGHVTGMPLGSLGRLQHEDEATPIDIHTMQHRVYQVQGGKDWKGMVFEWAFFHAYSCYCSVMTSQMLHKAQRGNDHTTMCCAMQYKMVAHLDTIAMLIAVSGTGAIITGLPCTIAGCPGNAAG